MQFRAVESPITDRELLLQAKVQAQAVLIVQLFEVLQHTGIIHPPFFDRLEAVWDRMEELPEGWPTSLGWSDGLRARVTDETRRAAKTIIDGAKASATS